MKKNIVLIAFLLPIIIIVSCTKKNDFKAPTDDISGVKIRYVLSVVAAENSLSKSGEIGDIKNAFISVVQNDSIMTKQVDANGMVYFDNLFAGNTIVNVKCNGYTTANFIVNLSLTDTVNYVDSENMRVVSTFITLFPTEGEKLSKIAGKIVADSDLTESGNEILSRQIQLFATVANDELHKFINHSVSGGILNLSYENLSYHSISNADGTYEISVPSSLAGLKIYFSADDIELEVKTDPTTFLLKYFELNKDSVIAYPNRMILKDLLFVEK